ncbi:MAG: HD family phosphohydrolase [Anaerolineae bacterium]
MFADIPHRRRTSGQQKPALDHWGIARTVAQGVLLAAILSAVLLVDFLPSNRVVLEAGDVSPKDILAPYDLTYESKIRTRQAQDAQAASVPEIYDPPSVSVARQQEVRARQILDYMSTVRADPYASLSDKIQWIAAIPELELSPDTIGQILALSEPSWQGIMDETVRVLIRAMQSEIREDQVTAVRRRLPTLISYTLTDDEAAIVEAIASGLVVANTFYNAARTEQAREQARNNTPPVTVTFRKGEAIVRQGSLVRPVDIEALDAFGLRQQAIRWQSIASAVLLAFLAAALSELVIVRFQPTILSRGRVSLVTFLIIALFVIMGKVMLPLTDTPVPYLYPLPALSIILTILFGPALSMAIGIIVGLVGTYIAGGSMEITLYLLMGTAMGALSIGQAERLQAFLRAGLAIALTNIAVILLFGFVAPDRDILKVAISALVGLVTGGLAASLALAAFFILSSVLDIVTPFQLMELSRPTHPLFRHLLLKAPGTYHHTLLVSNMAEEAAERIGADGLLTRVGTYYHDIGKSVQPYFFAENRVGPINPHDQLDPLTSARIIINHVADGLQLADKYKLPAAIRAFIPEHHGTSIALAFYRQAVKAAGNDGQNVREEDFRYPGPKPQSKETAIAMLADSCEARVRSTEPTSVEEIDRIIRETIKAKLEDGQLNDSDLTLRDLKEIHLAFLSVLKGVFHPRVKYLEPVKIKGPDGQEVEV